MSGKPCPVNCFYKMYVNLFVPILIPSLKQRCPNYGPRACALFDKNFDTPDIKAYLAAVTQHNQCVSCFPRQTTIAVYALTLTGMVVFTFTLNLGHLWVVFLTAGILG